MVEVTLSTLSDSRDGILRRGSLFRQLLTRHKRRGTLVHAQTQEHQNEEQITRSEEPDENSVGDDNEVNAGHEEDGQKRSTSPKQTTKPRRKSRRTVKGRGRQTQQPQPEQIVEDAQEPSQSRPPQRKRRSRNSSEKPNAEGEPESRGGTVPVIVHRFANLSALRNVTGDDEGTPSETAQPDDPFGHHKYPSRNGVNPADVLGQICRETLEKTISKLAEGIEQESNSARRVEWTRKRKTVELFGVELEQRLFDMSELLDSNFVLSTRLKGGKRDMAFLRNRLVELRKEREDAALRIDEVRRKYTEDEHVKTEHDNLNNSLHDLQLAIDRGRKVDDEPVPHPVIGLEFLLRTVAHDVSSTAPGSHGGILHHVKSFNNELERTGYLRSSLLAVLDGFDALDVIVLESSVENGVEKGILYRGQTSLEPESTVGRQNPCNLKKNASPRGYEHRVEMVSTTIFSGCSPRFGEST
ncbi:AT hook domain-containing protein [Histoplasma capsulatum H143]|uniref:AT hook domain-containing protein n=1 Tax=Ajellomyces capsulatus (strain H143) TaxID=544712 RepID=C6HGY0_AJECH|nr:AT hook domain-containing protein [Histoplasma capsulatum H143]